ncbi:MAG TPA: UDP-N-acetylmuramoyl-tripeptide--D-alanyl-D-alanine ligase [Cytophagales bacterium]|nr:UDP-N-acetylmuramoyl-tripeptide--D-alanyl-D-alanine ligase [Cytophagales bacterium]
MAWLESLYNKFLESTGVSTDTRKMQSGELFFALSGPNFNGNTFARAALEAGASYAVVDDPQVATNDRFVVVEDTLEALQALARHHRRTFSIPFIGITGSNGKTTCKELTQNVLRQKYRVHATAGNLNNHIGVPLTLLSMPRDTQIAIIEMGANKVGDIAELCAIAEPTHGFITNIGKAHLEGFGGIEGVKRGKSELYHWLIQHGGDVFINDQDPILSNMAKRFQDDKVHFFPSPGSYLRLEFVSADPFVNFRNGEGKEYHSHLAGPHHFGNLAVAMAVGKFFAVPAEEAEQAAADYLPTNNRSQLVYRGETTLMLDAYNANPNSMAAALANLKAMDAERKVVILGDMLELGEEGPHEHRMLADLVQAVGPEKVILVGELMRHLAAVVPGAHSFASRVELKTWLKDNPFGKATVLIKGSRSIGLEGILEVIPEA